MKIIKTDASYYKETKEAKIAIIIDEIFQYQLKNIEDSNQAEYLAIITGLNIAITQIKEKYIIIMNDNKNMIEKIQKEYLEGNEEKFQYFKLFFNSIQFLWVPREHNHIADMISKEENWLENNQLKLNETVLANMQEQNKILEDKKQKILNLYNKLQTYMFDYEEIYISAMINGEKTSQIDLVNKKRKIIISLFYHILLSENIKTKLEKDIYKKEHIAEYSNYLQNKLKCSQEEIKLFQSYF